MILEIVAVVFVASGLTYLSLLVLTFFILALYHLVFFVSWGSVADIDNDEIHNAILWILRQLSLLVVGPCIFVYRRFKRTK